MDIVPAGSSLLLQQFSPGGVKGTVLTDLTRPMNLSILSKRMDYQPAIKKSAVFLLFYFSARSAQGHDMFNYHIYQHADVYYVFVYVSSLTLFH